MLTATLPGSDRVNLQQLARDTKIPARVLIYRCEYLDLLDSRVSHIKASITQDDYYANHEFILRDRVGDSTWWIVPRPLSPQEITPAFEYLRNVYDIQDVRPQWLKLRNHLGLEVVAISSQFAYVRIDDIRSLIPKIDTLSKPHQSEQRSPVAIPVDEIWSLYQDIAQNKWCGPVSRAAENKIMKILKDLHARQSDGIGYAIVRVKGYRFSQESGTRDRLQVVKDRPLQKLSLV